MAGSEGGEFQREDEVADRGAHEHLTTHDGTAGNLLTLVGEGLVTIQPRPRDNEHRFLLPITAAPFGHRDNVVLLAAVPGPRNGGGDEKTSLS